MLAQKIGSQKAQNTAARLAAVQILYQLEINPSSEDSKQIIEEFLTCEQGPNNKHTPTPDVLFLDAIIVAVKQQNQKIDEILEQALNPKFKLKRLEIIIRSVLRAAVAELLTQPHIAAKIILNDYVSIGRAFDEEISLINGVLDPLARTLRDSEF